MWDNGWVIENYMDGRMGGKCDGGMLLGPTLTHIVK